MSYVCCDRNCCCGSCCYSPFAADPSNLTGFLKSVFINAELEIIFVTRQRDVDLLLPSDLDASYPPSFADCSTLGLSRRSKASVKIQTDWTSLAVE